MDLKEMVNNITICATLPEKCELNQLYIIADEPDKMYISKSNMTWQDIDISGSLSTSEKRYFFPTNCVNCGNVLDKEGHCDCCGTYHNPTNCINRRK